MTANELMLLLLLMLSGHISQSVAAKTSKTKVVTSTSMSISSSSASASSTASIPSSQLPLEARNAGSDGSEEEEVIATSYVLPNQIFNDGKPYYAGKDPISGQLDFSAKKAGLETAANEVYDPKEKIVLSNSAPNIHDFLNLPVKYSSSKFVYPLVSSSYANLKYQGNNKNYVTNKKPTSVEAPVTPMPLPMPAAPTTSNTNVYYTLPTTKLMAVAPTTSATTTTTNTRGPTTSAATSSSSTTSTTTTTTSKKPFTAIKLPPRPPPLPNTRYTTSTTSTRKPIPITTEAVPTYSTTTAATPVATTRKKFVPTKKYQLTTTPTVSTTVTTPRTPIVSSTPPASPVRFPDVNDTSSTVTHKSTNTFATNTSTTTSGFTKPRPTAPAIASSTTQLRLNTTVGATSRPVDPTASPSFSPLPSSSSTTRIPNLDAGDVYQTLGSKHTNEQQVPKPKPPMSLADLFNTIAEEDAALALNGGVFDSQGNMVQPIAPSKPSPFAMQGQTSASLRPATSKYSPRPPFGPHTTRPYHHSTTPQDVISGSQENFNNEYVSYQVQQPNVMQYRPVPGAINNVVISPGQHSASFVLGSQQQVGIGGAIGGGSSGGTGGNVFGSVEKEPLFGAKKPNVQYGTVINEDISSVANANGHQNGRPNSIYQSEPPPAPSPYQQLPLVNSNKRQKPIHKLTPERPQPTTLPQLATTATLMTTLATAQPSQVPTQQNTQELLVSSNIRFPPPGEDHSEELPSGPVASGPPAEPHVNGHAQPLSLQQIQNSNPVVFPKPNEDHSVGHGSDIQIQQHDVLTVNQLKQKLNFPQSFSGPAQHMEPPPPQSQPDRFSTSDFNGDVPKRPPTYNEFSRKPPGARPQHDRPLPNILPQFRPNAKVSNGHPAVASNYNHEPGNIRVPSGQPPQIKRPPPPPQFAHRRQPLRYSYNNNNNRPPMDFSSFSAEAANNRRVYRLPPYGGAYAQRPPLGPGPPPAPPLPTPAQLIRTADGYTTIERHAPERLAAFEEEDLVINDPPQPMTASKDVLHIDETKLEPVVTLQMLQSQKKAAHHTHQHDEDDDDVSNNSNDTGAGEIQVPPVGDLEQQQHGLYVVYPMKNPKLVSAEVDAETTVDSKDRTPAISVETSSVSNYQNTPFTVGREEPQEPILKELKPKQQPQSLQQQTKQHLAAAAIKEKFPYPIEKPDPAYTNLQSQARVPGVLIAPRIINGAVGAESKMAPIAIAYTPTEPNPYRRYSNVNLATPVINEIRPAAVADTQTEQALKLNDDQYQKRLHSNHNNNEFDIRSQYFEKDFMAPFYPSVSLDSPPGATATHSKPTNGWNVLPSSSANLDDGGNSGGNSIATDTTQLYAKNKIDRADVQVDDEDNTTTVPHTVTAATTKTTTKTFELDQFQPELQGGFKPIYPPGYKVDSDDDDDGGENAQAQLSSSVATSSKEDKPIALASRMPAPKSQQEQQPPQAPTISSSTSTTSTTTTTTSTPKPLTTSSSTTSASITTVAPTTTATPTQRKKTMLETSLEALLFGDDADLNDDGDVDGESRQQRQQATTTTTTKTINGGARPLHMVPRMGPRSLKLSS